MIELIRHIEILLLENDCVVIPGFGGFIAHYMPAVWNETEQLFSPPVRTIGFNAQLKINDGVLVQSYMEAYDTDFSDATKILQRDIDQLIEIFHKEGTVHLTNIGEISISVHDTYVFSPCDAVLSPSLYGLDFFEIKDLKSLDHQIQTKRYIEVQKSIPKKSYEIKINRALVRNAVAATAAILIFFYMSTPIENTYIEKLNYAQLLPTDLLLEKQSLLTTPVGMAENKKAENINKVTANIPPVSHQPYDATKEETQIPVTVEKEEMKIVPVKSYHIIVGSVTSKSKSYAENIVNNLKSNSYSDASTLTGDGKIRISLMSFPTYKEAYKQLVEIRNNNLYKDAWLLVW